MSAATTLTWIYTKASIRPRTASIVGIGVVSIAFLLSFLQYCLTRVDLVRLAPMAVLIGGTLLFLLACPAAQRKTILAEVARPSLLAVTVLATVPALLSSLYRGSLYPFEYGLVMLATLASARVLLSGIGFAGLLRAFFCSTTLGMLIVAGLTFSDLIKAASGAQRYYPYYFEPNRIAFFAVTAIPAQLWIASRGSHHRLALVASALCVLVTVAASSRGSTGALLIGAAITLFLILARNQRRPAMTIARSKIAALLILLVAATAFCAAKPALLPAAGDFFRNKLAIDSKARGLDSGLTGRTNGWNTLLDVLPKTSWLVGNGYRTSDEDFDFSVDSGYLANAYEMGIFSTAVILAKYILVLAGLTAVYLTRHRPTSPIPFLIFTLGVFFANGFVHRVLFGYGDPASLFALFCFVSTRKDANAASGSWLLAPG